MATSQAFRVALHVPVLDPAAAQMVSSGPGGDQYASAWAAASGGGVSEAPLDGKQYGRQSAGWVEVVANPTWATLAGKPATFPPTLPIDWANITGQPATYPPTLPIAWTDVSGKPATFPPSAHGHPQSEVTSLVADLAGKEPLLPAGGTASNFLRGDKTWAVPAGGGAGVTDGDKGDIVVSASGATWLFDSAVITAAARTVLDDATVAAMLVTLGGAPLADPVFTGNPQAPTPTAGDSDTSIATTAFVSLAVSNGISNAIIECGTF